MNDRSQIRMTKPATAPPRTFRHSCFGFLSSFVIRHSSFKRRIASRGTATALGCFVASTGAALNVLVALCLVRAESMPGAKVEEPTFRFELLGLHEPVEHTFYFENAGEEVLQMTNVIVAPPLDLVKASAKVAPGEKGSVTVRLGEPRRKGEYEGKVEVAFRNPGVSNLIFRFVGKITPNIELLPMPAFFVATQRGQPKQASLQIINHEREPLEIYRAEHTSSRFITELETAEPGQLYTLTLTLRGDGKPGKLTEPITLITSSKKQPMIKIEANTLIKERVYSFPDSLDLGVIRIQELKSKPQLAEMLAQHLMVYQDRGTDFELKARTDLPFLKLAPEQSKFKDRYQIKVEIIPEKLKPGRIESSIAIETNDREFSRLDIPVKAVVE
jgi:hypothetical protein